MPIKTTKDGLKNIGILNIFIAFCLWEDGHKSPMPDSMKNVWLEKEQFLYFYAGFRHSPESIPQEQPAGNQTQRSDRSEGLHRSPVTPFMLLTHCVPGCCFLAKIPVKDTS
ncbi:MAG: hypothetical protein FWC50_07705 [Planctomycetaceae bacterium]|nr:hypothetical protein [Planctomycetaceae bacterium]